MSNLTIAPAQDDALTAAVVGIHGPGYSVVTNSQGDATIKHGTTILGHVDARARHADRPYVGYVNVPGSAVSTTIRAFGHTVHYATRIDAAFAIVQEYIAAARGTSWEIAGPIEPTEPADMASVTVTPGVDFHDGRPCIRIATMHGMVSIPRYALAALAEHVTYWDATLPN